ncbi:MAG TPA: hypothetical protein VGW38_27830, partial [Chloroflexota bacterium]|nr:hypothetical protein [Chloroflexota bacterium]
MWALAYRLGLVLSAALLLWQVSWPELAAEVARDVVAPATLFPLAILLGVACAAGVLTLHFEERPNVALMALPVSLAWWQLGTPEALLVAGTGAL